MRARAAAPDATITSTEVVRVVLAELAKRGILPTFGPRTMGQARPHAVALLLSLGVQENGEILEPPADLDAYRMRRAGRNG